jgi:hypothetical protein
MNKIMLSIALLLVNFAEAKAPRLVHPADVFQECLARINKHPEKQKITNIRTGQQETLENFSRKIAEEGRRAIGSHASIDGKEIELAGVEPGFELVAPRDYFGGVAEEDVDWSVTDSAKLKNSFLVIVFDKAEKKFYTAAITSKLYSLVHTRSKANAPKELLALFPEVQYSIAEKETKSCGFSGDPSIIDIQDHDPSDSVDDEADPEKDESTPVESVPEITI